MTPIFQDDLKVARERQLIDRETGEIVEPHKCASCQGLQDQLNGAQREIRGWRTRYAELARDLERESESSPWWPIAIRLFQAWQQATGHGRSQWTHDRFAVVEPMLKKYGPVICERAIAGIAFDPYVTTRKNGSSKRHDDWETCFKNAGRTEEYANKAPKGWSPSLGLSAPAPVRKARRLRAAS